MTKANISDSTESGLGPRPVRPGHFYRNLTGEAY